MMKRRRLAKLTLCAALSALGVTCNGGHPPFLKLHDPFDGYVWLVGDDGPFTWQASNTGPQIRIELYRDGLGGASEVIGTFPASDDSQTWTPTAPTSVNCVLKATDTSDPAVTAVSGVFRIVGPGLYVYGPCLFYPTTLGNSIVVNWHNEAASQASITDVRIELSRDGGTTWEELAASVPIADWAYWWTVTDGGLPLPQPDCQFRVSEVGNPTTFDVSLPFGIEWRR